MINTIEKILIVLVNMIITVLFISMFIFLCLDGCYTNTRTECTTKGDITTCETKMDKCIEKWWWEK